MKDAFWFRHDSNAQHDERVLELRAEYGWEGYGIFWALVEKMRDAPDYRMSMATAGGLATSMGLRKPMLLDLITLCCTHGLFALEEEAAYFYSPSLRRRMMQWEGKKEALSEAGRRGAERKKALKDEALAAEKASQVEATLKPPLSHPSDSASIEEKRREEESKEQDIKERTVGAAQVEKAKEVQPLPAKSPTIAPHTRGANDVVTQEPLRFLAFAQSKYATPEGLKQLAVELKLPDANVDYYLNQIGLKAGREDNRTPEAWHSYAARWLKNEAGRGQLITDSTPLAPQAHAVTSRTPTGPYGRPISGAQARLHVPAVGAEGYGKL